MIIIVTLKSEINRILIMNMDGIVGKLLNPIGERYFNNIGIDYWHPIMSSIFSNLNPEKTIDYKWTYTQC